MINTAGNLNSKQNKKPLIFTFVVVVILLVILVGVALWIDEKTKKEHLATGLPRRSVPEFVADEVVNLFNKIFTGEESPKIKIIEEKEKEIKELRGKEEPLSKKAISIKEDLIKRAISENRGDFLLQRADGYTVEYIKTPDVFIVMIVKEPVETYRKEAQNWFLSQGFSQDDLCNLGVHFVLEHSLRLKLNVTTFDQRPSGCE